MKEFLTSGNGKVLMITTFLSIVFLFITYNWFIEFSSFSVGLAKGALGLGVGMMLDHFAFKEIDTIEELKKGNVAYAIFFLAHAVIIASAIIYS